MEIVCKNLKGWKSYCIHLPALTLFYIFFMLVFNPETGDGVDYRALYQEHYTMNLLLNAAIVLVCESLVRLIYTFLNRAPRIRFSSFGYILWCLLEILVISLFTGLYTCLILKQAYLHCFLLCMGINLSVLSFPYIVIALAINCHDLADELRHPSVPEHLMRFYDSGKRLKLTIAASAVLYLESDENYVNICYLESGRMKTFVLRTSMKSLEKMSEENGLRRCHRRYIVNPSHVRVLRKEAEGVILAELDVTGMDPIPVSRRYYESISDLL